MTAVLRSRGSRAAWRWCVVYTALLPAETRKRRREELRGHLWESEQSGHASRLILGAAMAGAPDDVGWAVRRALRRVGRALLTPMPYVVVAGILPVQAAFYWSNRSPNRSSIALPVSELAAVCCLLVAGSLYLLRRRR